MTYALAWSDAERTRVAELTAGSDHLIGRAAGSTIHIDEATVSREHATLRSKEGHFVVENLSRSNPTKLNGTTITTPVPVSDGDRLQVGAIEFVYHDLAAQDRVSGPICGHCGRENSDRDKDCWYCGTSLVYATSRISRRRPVLLRVLADPGPQDIYEGEVFVIPRDGAASSMHTEQVPADVTRIEPDGGKAMLRPGADAQEVAVNGEPAEAERQLLTGDELRVGKERFVVLLG